MSATTSLRSGADEEPLVEVRNATVRFDMERGESRVLDDVSIDIQRDEILGVVGESGSGKSMFASALLDAVVDPGVLTGEVIYHPEEGDPIDILDLDRSELKRLRWEEIAMVFQGAMNSFNPTMRLRAHFEETIQAHGADHDERMEHAERLLRDLYLDPERVLDAYPHELSGGMKQRALIALSLLLEPRVLVMDEPTAALDLLMQRSIISLLADLTEEYDVSMLFITHDLPLITGLVDRVAVMYAFQVVEVGPTADVISDAKHPYTRALLRSAPSVDTPVDEMEPIEGTSPDPVNTPVGCSFHPRCPLADERCEENDPPLDEFSDPDTRQAAACFYTDQSADAIPYTLHGEEVLTEEDLTGDDA
jgi:oligopeptide/dipeptide ABC transporter ATP-binding protein